MRAGAIFSAGSPFEVTDTEKFDNLSCRAFLFIHLYRIEFDPLRVVRTIKRNEGTRMLSTRYLNDYSFGSKTHKFADSRLLWQGALVYNRAYG